VNVRFGTFTVVKIKVEVFWVLMPQTRRPWLKSEWNSHMVILIQQKCHILGSANL